MIRKETMDAARPMAMLAIAMVWMTEEKPSCWRLVIRFDMKYDKFNLLNFRY